MRIVITGITGFIGKNLYKILPNEYEYLFLVRNTSNTDFVKENKNIKIQRLEAFNSDRLKTILKEDDIVIHMVGQMGGYNVTEEQFKLANEQITNAFIETCMENKVKQFIFVSTPGVQGFGHRKCTENEAYAPRNLYEMSKVQAENSIINGFKDSDVKYTIVRPDFVYGPEDYRRIKLYKNIRDGKFILTTSGKSYLSPTHVYDVASGILCCVNNPSAYNEIFNISAYSDITVSEYVKTIASYFGRKPIHINLGYKLSIILSNAIEVVFKLLGKEPFVSKNKIDFLAIDHSTSAEKAMGLIGYKPYYNFSMGFKDTMKWMEENKLI